MPFRKAKSEGVDGFCMVALLPLSLGESHWTRYERANGKSIWCNQILSRNIPHKCRREYRECIPVYFFWVGFRVSVRDRLDTKHGLISRGFALCHP